MRDSTKNLIKKYALLKLKYDFMGYSFEEISELSFHHIIIPKCACGRLGLGRGYYEWNGVILGQRTSHEYLHIVENHDFDRFLAITSEMLDQKIKGYLDMKNIAAIDDILESFEREYSGVTFKGSHKEIIKPAYTQRILQYKKTITPK